MKEPRRWLDASADAPEVRLLRAAVDEPLPNGALARAGKRLGVSATLLGATSASVAKAAAAPAAAGVHAGASAFGGTAVVATVAKGLLVGVGVAATITGAVHWAAPSRAPSPGSSSASLSTAPTSASRSATRPPATRGIEPRGPEGPVPPAMGPVPSRGVLQEQEAYHALRGPADAGVLRPSEAPARARFDESPAAPDPFLPRVDASGTPPAPAESENRADDSALAREVRLLDDVRQALRQGNAALALERLDQGKQQGQIHLLNHEASLLRVEALAHAGRTAEAAALARRLLARGVSPSQRRALESWLQSSKQ
jgi:hypothetical protein